MIQAAKIIGTGLATTGLIGAGVGMSWDWAPLLGVVILTCFILITITHIIHLMPMPGVKCPKCAEAGREQWVLPGKHCPRCSTACRHFVSYLGLNIFQAYLVSGSLFIAIFILFALYF